MEASPMNFQQMLKYVHSGIFYKQVKKSKVFLHGIEKKYDEKGELIVPLIEELKELIEETLEQENELCETPMVTINIHADYSAKGWDCGFVDVDMALPFVV